MTILRGLILTCLLSAAPVLAAPAVITAKNLEVHGLSQRQMNELRAKFGAKVQAPSVEDLENMIRYLYATEAFEDVDWSDAGKGDAKYVLTAHPIHTIEEIVIEGNAAFSRSAILDSVHVRVGDRLDRAAVEEGAKALKDKYGEEGFVNAEIEILFSTNAKNNYVVTLKIKENEVCRFEAIDFVTPNTELKKVLGKKFARYENKNFRQSTVSAVQQEVADFFAENRYLTASLQPPEYKFNDKRTRVTVNFTIERPFRFALLFDGNTVLSRNDIIRELNLNAQNSYGLSQASDIATRLEQVYRKLGYGGVQVAFNEKVFNQEFVRQINFTVTEGQRTRIKELHVGGTLSRPEIYYDELIKANASKLINSGYYNKEDVVAAVDASVIALQNEGYLRAKSQSVRAEYSNDKNSVIVYIQIEEGPLTHVKKVEFTGNTAFSDEELAQIVRLKVGEALKLTDLDAGIEELKRFYLDRSYLDVRIENEKEGLVKYNEAGTEASLNFQVHEGPPVRVGSIAIEGLTFTKEYVVKKELEFGLGDALTPEKISDTQYRLQRLGLFSAIEVSTLEVGTPTSDRTVVIRLSERDPGYFTSGLGVSSEFGLTTRGYLGIAYRNIAGTARSVSSRVEVKRITNLDFTDYQVSAGYLEPYLLDSRWRGRANLTSGTSLISQLGGNNNAQESNQLELLLERDFTRHFKMTWNAWTIAFLRDFELANRVPEQKVTIATFGPALELDYRDNPFLTKKGHYSRLNLEYSDPIIGSSEKVRFFRATAGYNYYQPIGRLVWAQSVRGGYVSNLFEGGEIPEIKRFYLGGRSTLRGYDISAIPPLLATPDGPDAIDNQPRVRKDSYYYLYKSEVRIPIVGDFEGVVFYDGGGVHITGYNFDDEYRDAAGIGFRYNTPVGPVSAEYGWKLDRKMNESEGRFDFSIGTF